MNKVTTRHFMKENNVLIAGVLMTILIIGGAFGYKKFSNTVAYDEHIKQTQPKVITMTVGEDGGSTNELALGGGSSWSGEILSAMDVNIQPRREGTIVEWYVKIGEPVYQGQSLGKLSAPPRTADIVQAIASQSESLARAKAEADANTVYIQKKIAQLESLRSSYSSMSTTANASLIETKKKNVQSVLQSSLSKIYPAISVGRSSPNTAIPLNLLLEVGAINSNLRNVYPQFMATFLTELKDQSSLPEKIGLAYFDTTVTLLNASVSGENISANDIANIKSDLALSQQSFITALKEYKEGLITNNDKNQDIDSQILSLQKDLALAKADVSAKQVSYDTVVGGLTGGLEIIATHGGTVSTISKRIGDFVKPEDTIVTVNGDNSHEKLVRFRIPSNAMSPKSGDTLTVVRPGFLDTKVKVKVLGVGSSLDTSGAYMADAKFLNVTDWPVHASVRVIPSMLGNQAFVVPFTAIFWSEEGATKVWTVTSQKTLVSKEITAGKTFGDTVEITEGLLQGDIVVIQPIAEMKENMLVSIGDTTTPQIKAISETKEVHDESKPHSHDE